MEELPVAAGRSVATGAMCVNLLPCHFFCLSPHSPPLLLLSSPPFSLSLSTPLHSPPDSTPSTYTPLWQITPGGWFVGCQKCSLRWHEGGASRRRGVHPPQFPSTPTAPHTCVSPRLSVEMSQWKLIFCLIRSHQIRCCPCLISSHIRFPTLLLTRLFLILARVGSRREGLLFAEEELEEEQERKMRASEQ